MADATTGNKMQQLTEQQREQVKDALKDGLAGRKAMMRAYETIGERVKDSETKTMLRRFADEEKMEYQKAEEVCRRYGVDVGAVENIRNEVVAFLGKAILSGGKGVYGDIRDLTMLYGAESSAHVAAEPIHKLARQLGDNDWANVIEGSRERCRSHADYLEGRIGDLSREAFGIR